MLYKSWTYINSEGGKLAIYMQNLILGQLVVALNFAENINDYACKKNETKLIMSLYDSSIGDFKGLDLQLAYIILRGDKEKNFFSYRCNKEKSTMLYSYAKYRIPNAIISTCFKKYYHEIINKRHHGEEFLSLNFYLPSITDCKEKINLYRPNVSLNPVDCNLNYLKSFSHEKVHFQPHLLNSLKVY